MHTLTIALGLWAAIGPIVGIVVGHFLTRSWQREQWILDNRKQEYRDLLSAISTAYMNMVRGGEGVPQSPELQRVMEDAKVESFRVFRDRIFIAQELEWADLLTRWAEAVHNYEADLEVRKFADRFTKISKALVQMATRPSRSRPLPRYTLKRIIEKFMPGEMSGNGG